MSPHGGPAARSRIPNHRGTYRPRSGYRLMSGLPTVRDESLAPTRGRVAGLDVDPIAFDQALQLTLAAVHRLECAVGDRPVGRVLDPATAEAWFAEPLPAEGIGIPHLLERLESQVAQGGLHASEPTYFGWINSSGNQAATLTGIYLAALNHLAGKWDVSSAAAAIERQVLGWVAEFIGYPSYRDGVITSGGSASTVLALAAARARLRPGLPTQPAPRFLVVCSAEGHSCVDKAANLLGVARVRRIPVDAGLRMDVDAAGRQIALDVAEGYTPLAIIATAGTTNSGAVDDIERLADMAQRFGTWLHVDGSYGAAAARSPTVADLFAGLDRADSVAVNPHKWLFVPVEAGCLLLRHPDPLRAAFSSQPAYLSRTIEGHGIHDPHERTFQLTKDLKAVKVWATFLAYGADAIQAAIASNIRLMQALGAWVNSTPGWELVAPVTLSTVVFRAVSAGSHPAPLEEDRINAAIAAIIQDRQRAFLHTTAIHGRTVLRACSVNHRLTPAAIDILKEELLHAREVAQA